MAQAAATVWSRGGLKGGESPRALFTICILRLFIEVEKYMLIRTVLLRIHSIPRSYSLVSSESPEIISFPVLYARTNRQLILLASPYRIVLHLFTPGIYRAWIEAGTKGAVLLFAAAEIENVAVGYGVSPAAAGLLGGMGGGIAQAYATMGFCTSASNPFVSLPPSMRPHTLFMTLTFVSLIICPQQL
jgi:hypothetical protein